ncbi:MAG: hypothetical protein ACPGU5_05080 [Lishizhenia sp.]
MTYSYTFKNIQDIAHISSQETLIWILHADKIPPHIGISVDGYFFSLKTEGKDENIPFSLLVSFLRRREITAVAISLNQSLDLKDTQCLFEKLDKIPQSESCLSPILTLLSKSDSIPTVSELLKELEQEQQIKAIFGLNLGSEFKGLRAYSDKDIQERINKLRNV